MRTRYLWALALVTCVWARAEAQTTTMPVARPIGSERAVDGLADRYHFNVGPFYIEPTISIRAGVDTNVFNETETPQSDFALTVAPRASLAVPFARRALVTADVQTALVYFAEFTSERSVDPRISARTEVYGRGVTFFAEGTYLYTRDRLNDEIDLRARRQQNDVSGGVAVRLRSRVWLELIGRHGATRFDNDASFRGQLLRQTLNRDTTVYGATTWYTHSGLTRAGLRYEAQTDRFSWAASRDTDSFRIMAGAEFKPRALVSGTAWVGYRQFKPRSSLLPADEGLVSQLALSYTLAGATILSVGFDRDYQFAYEIATPYYVDNGVGASVRRAIARRFDVTVDASRHRYDYRRRAVEPLETEQLPERVDSTDRCGLSVGYRLTRQTRVGVGVSYWTRRSSVRALRAADGFRYGLLVTSD